MRPLARLGLLLVASAAAGTLANCNEPRNFAQGPSPATGGATGGSSVGHGGENSGHGGDKAGHGGHNLGGSAGAGSGVCTPDDTECSGQSVVHCDQKASWQVAETCDFACHDAQCTGECKPEATRCQDGQRQECDALGEWAAKPCGAGTQCVLGVCLASDGEACSQDDDCVTHACRDYHVDADGDGYGSDAVVQLCGSEPPEGYVTNGEDCCDSDASARPGQTEYFTRERTGCGGHDFNCVDGDEVEVTQVSLGCGTTSQHELVCTGWQTSVPDCGDSHGYATTCPCTQASQSGCSQLCAGFTSRTQACH